ncbi:hypothetical protein AB7M42_008224 [Bradyrhizobium diazoefficiens]|jgi:hypothetical protein|uniref:Uncharacterized protein n=3 Tax=Bradyrhizobium TaxID=374 RepID=A0ABV4FI15_9BRAD|nr:hypothetical protein [Bradyrhizobium japonicum]MBP2430047.1 hypothetical protein [Bradyrhizobium elkanii]MCS3890915.1 hypothetical protein [Bradyrhizobium japonicum USDA 38]MCS4007223.1 hypothetical protein [Bradyrhizobium elkanii USDA 61]MBP1061356.1 hypothetical protein [Bradyrhizobium japonicum]
MTCEVPAEEAGRSETPAISAPGLLLNSGQEQNK